MATIKIQKGSVTKEQVREIIQRNCPDLRVKPFGVHTAVAETKWVGCTVAVLKGSVRTNPSIPSMKVMLFGALIALLGLIIPIVIYGTKVLPRQKAVDQRVAEVLRRELAAVSTDTVPQRA